LFDGERVTENQTAEQVNNNFQLYETLDIALFSLIVFGTGFNDFLARNGKWRRN